MTSFERFARLSQTLWVLWSGVLLFLRYSNPCSCFPNTFVPFERFAHGFSNPFRAVATFSRLPEALLLGLLLFQSLYFLSICFSDTLVLFERVWSCFRNSLIPFERRAPVFHILSSLSSVLLRILKYCSPFQAVRSKRSRPLRVIYSRFSNTLSRPFRAVCSFFLA